MRKIEEHARSYAKRFPPKPIRTDGISDNRGPAWMNAEWGHSQRERL